MRSFFVVGLVALLILALPGAVVFAQDLLGHGPETNAWLEKKLAISHRVALALPAAILLFCLPPLIILLYFLRLRRTAIAVPSTFLWKKSVEDLHVNRLMQWLRQNVLLLLQLLAVLMLIYAALGPRTNGAVFGGRHYILIIDNSASMSATDVPTVFGTRLGWAKADALREIDASTDADSGMVIVFNTTAEIRQSYTTNREELRAAIRGIEPTQFRTRIDEALSLAASRSNPDRSTANESVAPQNQEPGKERTYVQPEGLAADVHLFSDGKFPPVPEFALTNLKLSYHTPPSKEIGLFSNNVAIVQFSAERDPNDPTRLYARGTIQSFRGTPNETAKVLLDVRDGNDRLAAALSKTIVLGIPPEKSFAEADVVFEILDVAENADLVLNLKIEQAADALPLDDQAWLVVGQVRKARVLVVTPGNRVLRHYFDTPAAKKLADFVYIQPADWADPKDKDGIGAREGKYDLVLFDRYGPANEEAMPLANTLFLGYAPPPYTMTAAKPDDPNAVIPVASPAIRGWQNRHPAMKNLRRLDEVHISDAFRLPYLPPRTPRLLEGDRDLVLLAALPRRTFTDLVLTFPIVTAGKQGPDSVWHSDWPLQTSFVLFLRNVLITYGEVRETNTEASLQPGDITTLRMREASNAVITKPGGKVIQVERGKRTAISFAETDQVGVYRLDWEGQSRKFTVNLLDSNESDIAQKGQVTIGAGEPIVAGEQRKQPVDLWKYFVLAGLIVVVVEWWIYNNRVQI